MKVLAVIPARYASTRFPAKPLVDLCGQSMIERVWQATCRSSTIDRVVVATEDERIVQECMRIGADCVLTSADLVSGTDRVAAAAQLSGASADIILNVQGDEPLLSPQVLDDLVSALRSTTADVATPIKRIIDPTELDNPTICKVTLRSDNTALYFSRSLIPHVRGAIGVQRLDRAVYWKHIGIYAYRRYALDRFSMLAPTMLEEAESLEQLRLLADGARYICVETQHEFVAVDTPEDAERVRGLILSQA